MKIDIEYLGSLKDLNGKEYSFCYHVSTGKSNCWVKTSMPYYAFSIAKDVEETEVYKKILEKILEKEKEKPFQYTPVFELTPPNEQPRSFFEIMGIV